MRAALWRGRLGGWRKVLRAVALAPLAAILTAYAVILFQSFDHPTRIWQSAFLIVTPISYAGMLVLGLPSAMLLSRWNMAGYLPLAAVAALPAVYQLITGAGLNPRLPFWIAAAGISVSTAFVALARDPT